MTLSDPMDCSLPDSSVHGIFQARALEWVASAFSILETTYFFNLFIWLCWVLVVAQGSFRWDLQTLCCGMWGVVPWPGIELWPPPSLGARSLSHGPPRKSLILFSREIQNKVNLLSTWQQSCSLSKLFLFGLNNPRYFAILCVIWFSIFFILILFF